MRSLLLSAAALAAITMSSAQAAPMLFEFTVEGFDGGGVVTGSFVAEDLDGDGQVSTFTGEVFDASVSYTGGGLVGPLAFGFGDLFGLVYDLDGTIGDGQAGDLEGIGFAGTQGEFILGVGPLALCDGDTICGLVTDFLVEAATRQAGVVSDPVAVDAIPLPGALALFAPAMLGGAALRRRAKIAAREKIGS